MKTIEAKSTSVSQKVYSNKGNEAVLMQVPKAAIRILDVGCGAGDNARILCAAGRSIDGITLSEDEAKLASQFCREVYVCNLELGLPDQMSEKYDVVICSHVLEHICYPGNLLNGIRNILTDGGVLVVALPNLFWWKNRIQLLRGRFQYQQAGIMDNTHFRWYTFHSAQHLLVEHGFHVVKASAEGGFPFGPLRKWLPWKLLNKIDRLSSSWFPGLIGTQLVYVAKMR